MIIFIKQLNASIKMQKNNFFDYILYIARIFIIAKM